jgi:hypothetical protein
VYATRQQLSRKIQADAERIEVAAMAKLGRQLAAGRAAGQVAIKGQGAGRKKSSSKVKPDSSRERPPTLRDLGIDRKTAALASRLASLPDQVVPATMREAKRRAM